MIKKARYPYFKTNEDAYVDMLVDEYKEEGLPFSREQISYAIKLVIVYILDVIEKGSDFENGVMELLDLCKPSSYLGDRLIICSDKWFLFKFIKRDASGLRRWFEEVLPQEEDQIEKYLTFISEMTKKVITEICTETEKYITEEKARFSAQTEGEQDHVSFVQKLKRERRLLPKEEQGATTSSSDDENEHSAKRVKINEEKNTIRTI